MSEVPEELPSVAKTEDLPSPVTEVAPPAADVALGAVEAAPEAASEAGALASGEREHALTADAMPLPQVVEALLFSTDMPLSAGKLAEIVGLDSTKPIKLTIEQLNKGYQEREASRP